MVYNKMRPLSLSVVRISVRTDWSLGREESFSLATAEMRSCSVQPTTFNLVQKTHRRRENSNADDRLTRSPRWLLLLLVSVADQTT